MIIRQGKAEIPEKHKGNKMNSEEFIKKINRSNLFARTIILNEVDSTNLFAKENIFLTPVLITAENQFSGRGRFSRKWLSEPKKNLTFTVVLDWKLKNENIFAVNFYVSLMIYFTLTKIISGKNITLKWPNDLMIDDKKICGILTESGNLENQIKRFYIGIGLNVNQEKFPDDFSNNVTSLKNVEGIAFDRYELLFQLAEKIVLYKDAVYFHERILYLWKLYSGFIGRDIRFRQTSGSEIIQGKAIDVSDDGALIIKTVKGEKVRHYSGEISFIF
jgi:BirA family biotin operon repressor/biotin-[acetyl-CoA-carboxylase] ligase